LGELDYTSQNADSVISFLDKNAGMIISKPIVRKVERKLVPVLEKLSVEELMETNTYQRFNSTIDSIFDNTDELELAKEQGGCYLAF